MGQVGTSVPSSKRVAKKARPQPKMKEASSFEGASLVSATPHREGIGGGVLRGYGYRPSDSSSGTPIGSAINHMGIGTQFNCD